MRALGIDPGPTSLGWALVDVTPRERTWLRGGTWDTEDLPDFVEVMRAARLDLVAVEVPNGIYRPRSREMGQAIRELRARGMQLAQTMGVAMQYVGAFRGAGMRVVEISASDWRRGVVGKSSPTDAQVAAVLERIVMGMPRTNAHARDALGCALAAAFANGGTRPATGPRRTG